MLKKIKDAVIDQFAEPKIIRSLTDFVADLGPRGKQYFERGKFFRVAPSLAQDWNAAGMARIVTDAAELGEAEKQMNLFAELI